MRHIRASGGSERARDGDRDLLPPPPPLPESGDRRPPEPLRARPEPPEGDVRPPPLPAAPAGGERPPRHPPARDPRDPWEGVRVTPEEGDASPTAGAAPPHRTASRAGRSHPEDPKGPASEPAPAGVNFGEVDLP